MPEITGSVTAFAKSKNATTIYPMPSVGPAQRGPTCGFYALGFVMQYWYERQYSRGETTYLKEPLPVRTKATVPAKPAGPFEKVDKLLNALDGEFSSLRHYGKYNKLTAYGSVFNAESMVKIAKGRGAQYAGQYEGRVLTTTDPGDLVDTVQRFLEKECPLIIPFDVGKDGDPVTTASGKQAHWAVIVGSYTDNAVRHFIHYHWGKYRHAKALDFGVSNHGLTSNELVTFEKIELRRKDNGSLMLRDYVGPSTSNQALTLQAQGKVTITKLGSAKQNLEFNNPAAMHATVLAPHKQNLPDHGFDAGKLADAGLIRKLVAVYPESFHPKMAVL